MKAGKIEGTHPALTERVSRRLGSDGELSTQQAARTIRIQGGRAGRDDRERR